MTCLVSETWKNGKRKIVPYLDMLKVLKEVSEYQNHKIIIGTDSVKSNQSFIFTSTICILNEYEYHDRTYFYNRKKIKDDLYYMLAKRLLKETYDSIEIANFLRAALESPNLEIHIDVNTDPKHKSSKFKNTLMGYVSGCGFDCRVKPESFVASSIADNHTRRP
tara:strand:- start:243 stop:734 length:492 start_codon:yes stop_codon:yes gene_type:complete